MKNNQANPLPRIIMGIDPGSRQAGCAIIKIQQPKPVCLLQVTLHAKEKRLSQRLASLHQQLAQILSQYHPCQAAIEQVFVKLNPQSALTLGHARGVLLLALAQQQIPTSQYAPRLIKKACAGYGNASKSQIQQMMQHFFQLEKLPAEDAADALAVALCHAHSIQWRQKIANSSAQTSASEDKLWL